MIFLLIPNVINDNHPNTIYAINPVSFANCEIGMFVFDAGEEHLISLVWYVRFDIKWAFLAV